MVASIDAAPAVGAEPPAPALAVAPPEAFPAVPAVAGAPAVPLTLPPVVPAVPPAPGAPAVPPFIDETPPLGIMLGEPALFGGAPPELGLPASALLPPVLAPLAPLGAPAPP